MGQHAHPFSQTDLQSLPTAGDLYHHPHSANAVTAMADLVAQRLQELYPSPPDDNPPAASPSPALDQANSLQTRESSLAAREAALLTQMTEMMSLMRNTSRSRNRNNNRANRPADNPATPPAAPPEGRQRCTLGPQQYCWSHGWCAHNSAACNNQSPGHQVTATVTNMQGGSTNNCFWIAPA